MNRLWYFAHPYTGDEEANFKLATLRTQQLMDLGYVVYSPITYTHPLHVGKNRDYRFWMNFDKPFVKQSNGGLILAPRWESSGGCREELDDFLNLGREILLYRENIIPRRIYRYVSLIYRVTLVPYVREEIVNDD